MKNDYYGLLEVPETASSEDIKKNYRKLAMKYHPDRNPGNKAAEAKFKEISEAYYVLSDPKRREEYNQARRFGAGGAGEGYAESHGFNFEELLRAFRSAAGAGRRGSPRPDDIFDDLFSGFGGAGFRTAYGPGRQTVYQYYSEPEPSTEPRADVYVNLKLSKEKAAKGGRVTFRTPENKTISVTVPPHTRPGQKLKLTRQGRVCPHCKHRGDLILQIKI